MANQLLDISILQGSRVCVELQPKLIIIAPTPAGHVLHEDCLSRPGFGGCLNPQSSEIQLQRVQECRFPQSVVKKPALMSSATEMTTWTSLFTTSESCLKNGILFVRRIVSLSKMAPGLSRCFCRR